MTPTGRSPATAPEMRPALPRKLQVEVTASCNLRCRMCLVAYRPPVDRVCGSMTFERFRAVLDELPDVEEVVLQGLGEPLLCPDLIAMVEEASRRGTNVGFNTNGTMLTRAKAESLVRAGLDWICVSLDGATAETFESIRRGARFEKVVENLAGLVATRRRLGASKPEIRLVFVAMRRNVAELPALVRLAAHLGVDRVAVQNISHTFDDTIDGNDTADAYEAISSYARSEALWTRPDSELEAIWTETREAARRLRIRLTLPSLRTATRPEDGKRRTPGCDWPWSGVYVLHDGRVQPCCMVMGSDRVVLGDSTATSLAAVWHGEPYREFRRALVDGPPPDVCRGCAYYRGVF